MKTEIICILDQSGSMGHLRDDVIGGFNTFLADQQKVPGEGRITFVVFDGASVVRFQAVPLEAAEPLTRKDYSPAGSTALLDAIGYTLNTQGKRIADEGWAELVIVNIITDGEENCSTEYTRERIKEMIAHAQDKAGWVFLFQAANQDAFATGSKYGISAATTSNFTASAAGMREAYGATSLSTTTMRSAVSPSVTTMRAAVSPSSAVGTLLNAVAGTPLPPGVLPDAVASGPTP